MIQLCPTWRRSLAIQSAEERTDDAVERRRFAALAPVPTINDNRPSGVVRMMGSAWLEAAAWLSALRNSTTGSDQP